MDKIRFKDLSISLKIATVMSWIVGIYLGFAFLIGFVMGILIETIGVI
ncbi:hypothetical protein LCGC14_1763120 [marine sediment metagenome]|uniref:Uncharacterized protein n=1 Tax=marine sediment metagenome TaxID=412755 RepID=A0A0F9H0I5_9ZZZZ